MSRPSPNANDLENAIAFILALLFAPVVVFVLCYLIAWLVVSVASGFGATWPFWPTVGAVFLVDLLVTTIKSGGGK